MQVIKLVIILFVPCTMRGFSIRLRILGMCDILVELSVVNYLLYLAVLSTPPPRTFWIWFDINLALAIADPPT